MEHNFESIDLVNKNNKLARRYRESRKLKNKFKKLIKKVVRNK